MGYSNEKKEPCVELQSYLAPVVFNNVRSSVEQTSRRKRQCYKCMGKIDKGGKYINHQFRYDKKIISISFHKECFN